MNWRRLDAVDGVLIWAALLALAAGLTALGGRLRSLETDMEYARLTAAERSTRER